MWRFVLVQRLGQEIPIERPGYETCTTMGFRGKLYPTVLCKYIYVCKLKDHLQGKKILFSAYHKTFYVSAKFTSLPGMTSIWLIISINLVLFFWIWSKLTTCTCRACLPFLKVTGIAASCSSYSPTRILKPNSALTVRSEPCRAGRTSWLPQPTASRHKGEGNTVGAWAAPWGAAQTLRREEAADAR